MVGSRTRCGGIVAVCGMVAVLGSLGLAEDPASQPAGIRSEVDPRVELIAIIFHLVGNPEYDKCRVPAYGQAVEEHFKDHRDHEVVRFARSLRSSRGVSFDAPMSLAVHLGPPPELVPRIPLSPRPPGVDARWRERDIERFLELARAFAKDGNFAGFWDSQRDRRELAEQRMTAVVADRLHQDWFDEFFGAAPGARFCLRVSLMNGPNCYGVAFRSVAGDGSAGGDELYSIMGLWNVDVRGEPAPDARVLPTLVHEFCHSYCNPLVDAHLAELRPAGEALYARVKQRMQRMAYANWETMMRESLVRASVIRYLARHEGNAAAVREGLSQVQQGFAWMPGLTRRLVAYERQRDQYPTLDSYMPEIVRFFDEYAKETSTTSAPTTGP